jgi:hypothetical protein
MLSDYLMRLAESSQPAFRRGIGKAAIGRATPGDSLDPWRAYGGARLVALKSILRTD